MIVHENFSNHTNDIALLKLGKYNCSNAMRVDLQSNFFIKVCKLIKVYQITVEERADLAKYPPVCLPENEQDLPKQAFVYGGFFFTSKREVIK